MLSALSITRDYVRADNVNNKNNGNNKRQHQNSAAEDCKGKEDARQSQPRLYKERKINDVITDIIHSTP